MTDKEFQEIIAVLPQEDRVKVAEFAYRLLSACVPRLEESAQHEASLLLAEFPQLMDRQEG